MISLGKPHILFLLLLLFLYQGIHSQNGIYLSSINQSLTTPSRVAVDNNDNIYVTDATKNLIIKFDPAGNFLESISAGGSPLSIAINKDNEVFIGDDVTGDILKLDPDGTPNVIYAGTVFPSDMTFVSDSLYIVDRELKLVIVITQSGNVVRRIGTGTFTYPTGIAYNPKNNRLFIAEHGGMKGSFNPIEKVWMFGITGNLIGSFGSHGNTDGKFYRIQGLDVDRCGNVYVPDPYLGRVSVFNESGVFLTKFGSWGDTIGDLNVPLDIVINSKDSIWITSMNNSSVDVYKINYVLPTSHIITGNKTICTGDTTNISIAFTGTAPWTFTYTIDAIDTIIDSNVTDNPYLLPVSQSGTYKVIALSDSGSTGTCFSGSSAVFIDTITPASAITSGNDTICAGETAGITINLTGTPPWTLTYTVDSQNPLTLTKVTADPYVLMATQPGVYEVIALSGAGCAGTSFTGTAAITVNPLPTAVITSGNGTICSGDTAAVTIDFTGTPPWSFSYSVNAINKATISNALPDPYTLNVTEGGIYNLTSLADANCSGTNFSGTAGITVNPLPTSAITSGNKTICSGSTDITFEFTGTPPWTFTYTIDSLNPSTVSNVTVNPYFLSVTQGGTYDMIALSDSVCSGTGLYGTAVIIVDSTPPASVITSGNATVCSGDTAGITIDFTGIAPWNFTYTIDGTDSATVSNVYGDPYILPVTQAGNYAISALTGGGCTGSVMAGSANISLNPSYILEKYVTICEGDSYAFGSRFLTVPGTYQERFTSVTSCDSMVALILAVNPLPTSGITSGNKTICSGNTTDIMIDFTGVPPWSFTYTTDSINPVTINNATANPYPLTVSAAGNYKVTAISDAFCAGTSFSGNAIISVDSVIPASNITSGDATICSGDTTNIAFEFTGTPPWTFTYTVDSINPTTISDIAATPFSLTVSQAGLYSVTALAGAGCTGTTFTGEAVITLDSVLPVSDITSGNATICSGQTTDITINFTGTPPWTFTYTIDSLNPTTVSNVTASPYNLTASQPGIYSVTALSGAGCTGTSFNGIANVTVNTLPIVEAGINQSVCNGTAVTLAGSGAVSYSWDNGVTDGVPFNPSATATYTVTGTDLNNCTNSDAVVVTIYSLPVVDAGTDQAVCNGTPVTLSGSGAVSYSWDNGVTDGVPFTPSATTTYTVTGTDINNCTNSDAVLVTIYSLPVVDAGIDQAVCNGTPVTLSGSGAVSYSWDNGVTDGVPFNPSATATYTVTGTDLNNCTNSDAVLVTLYSLPVVDAGTDQAVCNGTPVTLSGNGAVSYTWDNGVTDGVPFNPSATATYTVTGTDLNNCTNSDAVLVTLYSLPVVDAGIDQAVCNGTPVTLSGSGAVSYIWDNGVTDGVPFTPSATATYTVTGTDINNCTNSDAVLVTIYSLPVVDAGIDQAVCNGTPVTLSGNGAVSYTWDNGVTDGVPFNPSATTTYTVTGTDINNCTNSDAVLVTVYFLPVVDAGIDQNVCEGMAVTLSGSGAISYAWDNGVTDGVAFTPATTTTYTLIGTDGNGCTNTDSVLVTVTPLPVPAFTYTANGFEITFQNNSLNADSFLWDFGDGDTSALQNPVHTYQTTGNYLVTLTTVDAICGNMSFSDSVIIAIIKFESISIENIVKIYPNPTRGKVTIEIINPGKSDVRIEISNMLSQNIYSKQFRNRNIIEQIDLSDFSFGIYTVKVIKDDQVQTTKLILSD